MRFSEREGLAGGKHHVNGFGCLDVSEARYAVREIAGKASPRSGR